MENLERLKKFWKNKCVLVTGHDGFKGTWLTSLLIMLGAKVVGVSNSKKQDRKFFESLKLKNKLKIYNKNIQNIKSIKKIIIKHNPEFVFHLASQSIVSESFENPLENYKTNLLGIVNLLESLKASKKLKSIIVATSDKCYLNNKNKNFKETDSLGGDDPYSSSKACQEIISNSYYKSFFNKKNISVITLRAGNVIGGGDLTKNRLVPDIFRSIYENKPMVIRNPNHIRPWQNILDTSFIYMYVAYYNSINDYKFSGAYNIGPSKQSLLSVKQLLKLFSSYKKIENVKINNNYKFFTEKKFLALNSNKIKKHFNFKNKISIDDLDSIFEIYEKFYTKKINLIDLFNLFKKYIRI